MLPSQESEVIASFMDLIATKLVIEGAEEKSENSKDLSLSLYQSITITPYASKEIHNWRIIYWQKREVLHYAFPNLPRLANVALLNLQKRTTA